MIKNAEPISSLEFNKGLVTRSDFLKLDINSSPNTMDVQWNFDASLHKRLGSSSTNSVVIGGTAIQGWTIDSNNTLSTNLSAYWNLNEVGAGRADSVGMNNLNDINTTGSITGIRGLAALFIAANSNGLMAPSVNALTGGPAFSISSWIYLNSTSTTLERPIVSKRDLDANTVLLLHCEGANSSQTITDSSTYVHSVTANGSANISTVTAKYGSGSIYFNGTNGYLSAADSTDWNFGTGDFTIEFWVNFTSVPAAAGLVNRGQNNQFEIIFSSNGLHFFIGGGAAIIDAAFTPTTNTWYHIAAIRFGTACNIYVNGTSIGSGTSGANASGSNPILVGAETVIANFFNGFIDELRISNIARWTGNFSPPGGQYTGSTYEYYLYVNTNNNATFRVSSSGIINNSTVQASSIGALNTSTWYNVIAWHSGNSHIGISVNLSVNTSAYTSGAFSGQTPFMLGTESNTLTAFMNGRIDETGFWNKILSPQERSDLYGGGSGNTFFAGASGFSWASFDFGATSLRWVTIACGTGLVASSNLGTSFVAIGTSRTQTYQYLDRSKNVLIATSDAYDVPLYWAGSTGTFSNTLAPGSAPQVKFSINYNGFLILLNSLTRKRGFFYADENLQLTDPYNNNFDLPSSDDDEITAAFVLYKFLYISTRYRLFRLAFVGGNPDWSFLKVKDWGYVPRTVRIVSMQGGGQFALGMDWNHRMRLFDGFDDRFVSDNVENDNGLCDFAMNKISYAGSGLVISHAELNTITQEYRLNVAIGTQSSQTTHGLLLNVRNLAFYPYSNQQWQTMCMAESNNQKHLLAMDRSGFVYILDSGNLDKGITPINDFYDSPPLFNKLPEIVSKGKQVNFFFGLASCGTIFIQDRVDLSNQWSPMVPLSNVKGETSITGTENLIKVLRVANVPATFNTWQFRITSSANTANPWELDRLDFFQQGFGLGKGNNG